MSGFPFRLMSDSMATTDTVILEKSTIEFLIAASRRTDFSRMLVMCIGVVPGWLGVWLIV